MGSKGLRTVKPSNCTFNELCKMRRDHTDFGDFSLMTDSGVVWLSEQAWGKERKQHIQIPRGVFNRLLLWYQREAGPARGKRSRGK